MKLKFLSNQGKYNLVIQKNTFFFHNDEFEEDYEKYINSIVQLILLIHSKVKSQGLRKEIFVDLIRNKEEGLKALFALTGFSKELLLRLVTFIRAAEDGEIVKLVNKEFWPTESIEKEWNEDRINKLIRGDEKFAEGLVNLFFEGATSKFLVNALPLFELKKLNISKLDFSLESLIDTLVRYRFKGSYAAQSENNPEGVIKKLLVESSISFDAGRIENIDRKMDFIIPSRNDPKIIIESSYVVTTSSDMGNKARDEIGIKNAIKKFYPDSVFIGFIDGAGWYVRRGDLRRMVSAFDDVFTFKEDELIRFINLVEKVTLKS